MESSGLHAEAIMEKMDEKAETVTERVAQGDDAKTIRSEK